MTGKFPVRTGVTDFIGGKRRGRFFPAPNQDHLALEEVTIAETLRDAGYTNFFAGKWHLGTGDYSPRAQGFSAELRGESQFFYPLGSGIPDSKDDPKTTEQIADEAVAFIVANQERPFFAYLPFLAVHIPVKAPPALIAKYKAKPVPPEAWGTERENRVRLVQSHAGYAAMLEQLDNAVGRVIAALDRCGVADRTIVVFTSDNGGLSTAEGHPTSNLPFRGGKGWLYEGGVRVPWIIRAPGVTRHGSVCNTPVISNDFYPTLLALAGLPQKTQQHRDGVNLAPLLAGRKMKRAPLFWHYPHYSNQGGPPAGAVRDGDWKLIEWYEGDRLELYNINDDPAERKNLAEAQPGTVKRLQQELAAWRSETKALMPMPDPNFMEKAVKREPSKIPNAQE